MPQVTGKHAFIQILDLRGLEIWKPSKLNCSLEEPEDLQKTGSLAVFLDFDLLLV